MKRSKSNISHFEIRNVLVTQKKSSVIQVDGKVDRRRQSKMVNDCPMFDALRWKRTGCWPWTNWRVNDDPYSDTRLFLVAFPILRFSVIERISGERNWNHPFGWNICITTHIDARIYTLQTIHRLSPEVPHITCSSWFTDIGSFHQTLFDFGRRVISWIQLESYNQPSRRVGCSRWPL